MKSDDLDALLHQVPTDGATIGNGAVREALGWDEVRYNAAKDALVANGTLRKGQGRGGTVRRAVGSPTPAPAPAASTTAAKPAAAPVTKPIITPAPAPATKPADQSLSAFIWSVADLLRGDYKQSDYAKVILPFTVLRRLDCVLEPTKETVLAELAKRTAAGLNPEPFLLKVSGQLFFNTSPLDLKRLMGDQDHIGENLRSYIQAFSPAVRDIFESFEIHTQIDRLAKANLLYLVTEKFANIDLHPEVVSNAQMGAVVAFSGEVNDPESGSEAFTERSQTLNPGLKSDIREAFIGDDFRILLVANKFQTGFDQPLLCGMYVDKRLAGIQAVQTLSRLNRSHPGKDTTYVLDFVNDADEVLEAFKTYHTTAELAAATDPNLVLNLRAKLDAAGHYDDNEVERVVAVELNPTARQGELVAALEPVADRLIRSYKAAQDALRVATVNNDQPGITTANEALEALRLFKGDLGAFVRAYTFLSQIFDYGNTAIEKRSIFFKRLLPLLEFGREREGIDLSKVVLTHHNLKNAGQRNLSLGGGETPKLDPLTESGGGKVQEKQKAYLAELIDKVNSLFDGELSDTDKLVYVNNVILGKMLESETLIQQAANNTKEQFASSPDLPKVQQNAIISALDAHTAMSAQALNSPTLQAAMLDILLNHAGLWEALRAKAAG